MLLDLSSACDELCSALALQTRASSVIGKTYCSKKSFTNTVVGENLRVGELVGGESVLSCCCKLCGLILSWCLANKFLAMSDTKTLVTSLVVTSHFTLSLLHLSAVSGNEANCSSHVSIGKQSQSSLALCVCL